MILNGSYNKKGEWMYMGKQAASIVDYAANEKAEENIKMIVKGDRTKSDHVPLKMELKEPETNLIRQERTIKLKKVIGQKRKKKVIMKDVKDRKAQKSKQRIRIFGKS